MTTEETAMINRIMENFPFEKVLAYMLLTNWTWVIHGKNEQRVPTLDELRFLAQEILFRVADCQRTNPNNQGHSCGTGGFNAYRFVFSGKPHYKLTFEPFKASSF